MSHAADSLQWVRNGAPTSQALQLSKALTEAERFGLAPNAYQSGLTVAQLQTVATGAANADLLHRYDRDLSQRASRFATHLRYGRVNPRQAGFDLPARTVTMDEDIIAKLAHSNDVEAALSALEPTPAPYRMLKQALARYRQLSDERLEPLPALATRAVRHGEAYADAELLRRRLTMLGDLPADAAPGDAKVFDEPLVQALKSFQTRHGLLADGILGKQTHAALNVPLQRRVRQIELSLERWRWLNGMPRPDIVINVPQYMLYALPRAGRPGETLLEIPVIVGRTRDRTPLFTSSIKEVVFNPYWDVPRSIMRNELLPKIRKNPSYLRRNHYEIVQGASDNAAVQEPTPEAIAGLEEGKFRLRQRPGPDNALGPVKFIMPNPYSIRLHGTSEPGLFQLPERAFSHGCIRVSDPAALAEYVLVNAPGDWNSETVATALCGTEPRRVVLDVPVRVLVFYATAAATTSRGMLFSADVYGLDARLEKLLAAQPQS
ncbi:MAG TPA: L,D-transpeptidase family protein [Steroidobacter sp.]|uniref:L,D-transpeptidase family protein n=1 Tax=Steroidobacter sp. TaxID=1978227 RepID=UPI002ED82EDC